MCTVTYIPVRDTVFITSNRDERIGRSYALPPAAVKVASGNILYPRDGDKGGTWIAAHENGNAVVLLNGALFPHAANPPYRQSRGLVVLQLIAAVQPYNALRALNLDGIEPFTVIIREDARLFECTWDSSELQGKELDAGKPYLWSSVTLYDEQARRKRRSWLEAWLMTHPDPDGSAIVDFHRDAGDGDPLNDLNMNRGGEMLTVSITCLEMTGNTIAMQYVDMQQAKRSACHLQCTTSITAN